MNLEELIKQKYYEIDCLKALDKIVKSGNCNTCKKVKCEYSPKPGQLVRYNCPHYLGESKS